MLHHPTLRFHVRDTQSLSCMSCGHKVTLRKDLVDLLARLQQVAKRIAQIVRACHA